MLKQRDGRPRYREKNRQIEIEGEKNRKRRLE